MRSNLVVESCCRWSCSVIMKMVEWLSREVWKFSACDETFEGLRGLSLDCVPRIQIVL